MKPHVEIPPIDDKILAAYNRAAKAQEEWWGALAGLESAVGGIQLDMDMQLVQYDDTPEDREEIHDLLEIAANDEVVD